MVRLSFDQEAWSRGITTMPLPADVHNDIERVLRARLADLVRAGSDVVLDFSFWSRRMRDEYREFLRPFGVVPETVYLATDRATVLQRIADRAARGGDDFKLSTELAAFYFDHFEVPTAAEGPLTILKLKPRERDTVSSMSGTTAEWPSERRKIPAQLQAEAAANPGGWVYEIDGSMISDPNGYVPAEAIIGGYAVGPDGKATGEFLRNPGHGTVRDDFSRLESPDHWLGWLPDTPAAAVRSQIEEILGGQVPGSAVEWLKIVDEPAFLTTALKAGDDIEHPVINRTSLAVIFALAVRTPSGHREILTGAFTWVAAGLDAPGERRDRLWLDFGMQREQAAELLKERIYQSGAAR
jgi:hypothetical protein